MKLCDCYKLQPSFWLTTAIFCCRLHSDVFWLSVNKKVLASSRIDLIFHSSHLNASNEQLFTWLIFDKNRMQDYLLFQHPRKIHLKHFKLFLVTGKRNAIPLQYFTMSRLTTIAMYNVYDMEHKGMNSEFINEISISLELTDLVVAMNKLWKIAFNRFFFIQLNQISRILNALKFDPKLNENDFGCVCICVCLFAERCLLKKIDITTLYIN